MIRPSTIQLLRFHFSFFLMPVYWFALSFTEHICTANAIAVFIILHLLVYPASNGYNSYMDKDTGSIGGIKNPKQPTRQLFYACNVLDAVALAASCFLGWKFFTGILGFILASRAYSYRKIRLKKFPVAGYLTVIIFQGAVVFFCVMNGSSIDKTTGVPFIGMVAASLLVGGFYPLTQIYQHMQDKEDGVTTLSYLLGYRGTFMFTAIVYALAMVAIGIFFYNRHLLPFFYTIQLILAPVLFYFTWWFLKVYKDPGQADFKNTMRMNIIGSVFTNAAFIYLFISQKF